MKKNVWKENYEAPLIEWLDVAVEAGFAASDYDANNTGAGSFTDGGSDEGDWGDL